MAFFNNKDEIAITKDIKLLCNKLEKEKNMKCISYVVDIFNQLNDFGQLIIKNRKGKNSKLRDDILSRKVIKDNIKLNLASDSFDNFCNSLKSVLDDISKNIYAWSELKGGNFTVLNKISSSLKKIKKKIDTMRSRGNFIKELMLNEDDAIMKMFEPRTNVRIEIPNEISHIKNDVEEYIKVSYNLGKKLNSICKILNSKFPDSINIIKISPVNSKTLDKTKENIILDLQENQKWLKDLLKNNDLKSSKFINIVKKLSKINIKKFEKEIENHINKRESEKKIKEDAEKKYKDNLPTEIKNHKSLIEEIIKKLEPFKNIKYKGQQLKIGDYKGEYKVLSKQYSNLINKITVIETNETEKEKETEIVQFLRSIQTKIKMFSNLNQNKPQEKSMFEFSDNSITDRDDRFKTTYTLKDNKLTLEIYDRDKLSSKITVE